MQEVHFPGSNIDTVSKKVLSSWIPAQAKVVDEIISKVYCGFYEKSPELLRYDLKKDVSTYLYTLPVFARGDESVQGASNPVNQLVPLLHDVKKRFSRKEILDEPKRTFQLEILHEALMSASVVSEMSGKFSMRENTSYSVAMLRYLGKALIAWNYPKEFYEAIQLLRDKSISSSLDGVLTNIFGFSPSTLGSRIVLEMGVNKELFSYINPEKKGNTATYNRLLGLCELGESFAMAHSTIEHPIKADDVSSIISLISDNIGEMGLKRIYSNTSRLYDSYSKSYPQIYVSSIVNEENHIGANLSLKITLSRYARAAKIDKYIASKVINLVTDSKTPEDLIKTVFYKMLPSMGINSSLIFTLSPLERTLIPIFRKATPLFIKPDVIDLDPIEENSDIVRACFLESKEYLGEGFGQGSKEKCFSLSQFPEKKPIGVLYLESDRLTMKNELLALSRFVCAVLECVHGVRR
jgi:hypothetical protein